MPKKKSKNRTRHQGVSLSSSKKRTLYSAEQIPFNKILRRKNLKRNWKKQKRLLEIKTNNYEKNM